ncbi:hypothetical protein [Curtobacterium sp. VKM Ac-2922]|uniref:hypothetical protein n=1 Tax=Curtobacterium sp. VKM Ac-2922 TaxID=2929475 RepID=UPI001FB27251|nr:hypothetical protein [Curtobacterium sp. VKM Ac-2922]MCJ1713636.1 hypothetical protein [Curtobacterium sp. VKM Ac-2922]
MLARNPSDPWQPRAVPHEVLYVFADFAEVVRVDCWCDREADHVEAYPFYDEIIQPLIAHLARRIRRRLRKEPRP